MRTTALVVAGFASTAFCQSFPASNSTTLLGTGHGTGSPSTISSTSSDISSTSSDISSTSSDVSSTTESTSSSMSSSSSSSVPLGTGVTTSSTSLSSTSNSLNTSTSSTSSGLISLTLDTGETTTTSSSSTSSSSSSSIIGQSNNTMSTSSSSSSSVPLGTGITTTTSSSSSSSSSSSETPGDTSELPTITTPPPTTTSTASSTTPPITSTMTTVPDEVSTEIIHPTGITTNTWITTTKDSSTTIVPAIWCTSCAPSGGDGLVVIWDFPPVTGVDFDWGSVFPSLPSFNLPCIKVFGTQVAGNCPDPQSDEDNNDDDSDDDSTTTQSDDETTSTSTTSSSSQSCTQSTTASDCRVGCSVSYTSTASSLSSTTVCYTTSCVQTVGCSVEATTSTTVSTSSTSASACAITQADVEYDAWATYSSLGASIPLWMQGVTIPLPDDDTTTDSGTTTSVAQNTTSETTSDTATITTSSSSSISNSASTTESPTTTTDSATSTYTGSCYTDRSREEFGQCEWTGDNDIVQVGGCPSSAACPSNGASCYFVDNGDALVGCGSSSPTASSSESPSSTIATWTSASPTNTCSPKTADGDSTFYLFHEFERGCDAGSGFCSPTTTSEGMASEEGFTCDNLIDLYWDNDMAPFESGEEPDTYTLDNTQSTCNTNALTFTKQCDGSYYVTSEGQGGSAVCTTDNKPDSLTCTGDNEKAEMHVDLVCVGSIC